MASAALSLFRQLAPELSALADADVDTWIATASRRLDGGQAFDASVRLDAVVEFAAHLYVTTPRAGAGAAAGASAFGPVTSQSDNTVSRSYAVPGAATSSNDWKAWLSTSTHGRAFLALSASQGFGVRGVRLGP